MDCKEFKKHIHDYFTDPNFDWWLKREMNAHYFECKKCFNTYRITKLLTDREVMSDVASKMHHTSSLANLEKDLLEKAIGAFTNALEIEPRFVDTYKHRSLAWAKKDNLDKSIADYSKAIKEDPRCAEAYLNRGLIYTSRGLFDHAISDYSKAIEIDSEEYCTLL